MRVYIVEWFSAEPYADYSGIEVVCASEELARKYILSATGGVPRKPVGAGWIRYDGKEEVLYEEEVEDSYFEYGRFLRICSVSGYEVLEDVK